MMKIKPIFVIGKHVTAKSLLYTKHHMEIGTFMFHNELYF